MTDLTNSMRSGVRALEDVVQKEPELLKPRGRRSVTIAEPSQQVRKPKSTKRRKVTSSKYVEDDGGEAEQDQKMAEVEGEADDMADAPGEPDDGQHIGKSTHLR